jgi:hypothetical protein
MRTLLCIATAAFGMAAAASDHSFTGYARDLDSGRVLYVEDHAIVDGGTPDERRVVLYRCADSRAPFARKLLSYGTERTRPQFHFEDARSGFAESLTAADGRLLVSSRPGVFEPTRTRALALSEELVADAGFDEFIRASWETLARGEPLEVSFLVPSRLEPVKFRVRRTGHLTLNGASATTFRMSLAGVLGWVLPDIEVSYRDHDRRLLRYRGLTNIRDAEGRLLSAQIDFPESGRSGQRPDLEALLALPLASCGS